jgi:signal transduction histidine kinase
VGLNFLWLGGKRLTRREFTLFALTCFTVAAFDFGEAQLYRAPTSDSARFWTQFQYLAVCAFIPCFYGFFSYLTRNTRRGGLMILSVLSAALIPVALVSDLVTGYDYVPKRIPWLGVTVHEYPPGFVTQGYFLFGLALVFLVGARILQLLRQEKMAVAPSAAAYGVFCLGAVNDLLVVSGVYNSVYLMSLGFTILLLGISASLADRFARSLDEVRVLNTKMESRVVARTLELDRLNTDLAGRNAELEDAMRRLEEAQVQLLQAEKMSSLGQFAAGVAHEINNPMAYVRANLEQLLRTSAQMRATLSSADVDREKASMLLEDSEEIIQETVDGANRIVEIVKALRTLAHKGQPSVGETDLHACVETAITLAAGELNGRATLERAFSTLPTVRCNATEITQVILNLLVNAAQAMRNGGTIRVSTGAEEEWARVEVQDEGGGIRPEHLSRIFDPFFTTKEPGQGTGLGLSISYGIIRKHGGRIEARNAPGGGAIFAVILPIAGPGGAPADGAAGTAQAS